MNNTRKLKLAWKYRRLLWKYRRLYQHRRKIAGLALAGAASAGVVVAFLGHNRVSGPGR